LSKRAIAHGYLELARSAAAPHLSPAALRDRFGDTRDHPIERGQIWRASWDLVSVLVVVFDIDDTEIDIIPLTIDPVGEDVDCYVLGADVTAFGTEVTLWEGLRTFLPMRVFDEIVDELAIGVSEWLFDAERSEASPPDGLRLGRAPRSPFEASITLKAEIEDDLIALQSSPALPVASEYDNPPIPTLASLLDKKIDLGVLVEALAPLGLDQPEVMRLLRGKRPVTPVIALAVAQVTGVAATQVTEAVQPLPARFVDEVDHPRWRPVWRERADRSGIDEADARLEVSYEMFALAARQTGSQEPDWYARLTQFRVLKERSGSS
jgi:hypothetical protein